MGMMSHHMNDKAYEQRQELYWISYDRFIAQGYDASVAEDKAMEVVQRDMERNEHT